MPSTPTKIPISPIASEVSRITNLNRVAESFPEAFLGGAMAMAAGWRRWEKFGMFGDTEGSSTMWLSLKTQQLRGNHTTTLSTACT